MNRSAGDAGSSITHRALEAPIFCLSLLKHFKGLALLNQPLGLQTLGNLTDFVKLLGELVDLLPKAHLLEP